MVLKENDELKISLTVSDNQRNKSKNISSINLGECENKLKEFYNISKNESLLILKIEVKKKEMKIPRIEYEVFYPLNGKTLSKLDLNLCNNINIEVYIPIEIDDKDIDRYNSSSDFYKDICYIYKTKDGTDIILKDRKEEYINNDMSACEEICNFTDYDNLNNKAICSCEVKKDIKKFSEININKTLLYNSFTDVKNFMNLNIMKCYKELFSKNGLLYNIGFYIILTIIMTHFTSIIIFYSKDFIIIKKTINNMNNFQNNMRNKYINKKEDKKEIVKQNGKNEKKKKRNSYNLVKNDTSIKSIKIKKEPPIKKSQKRKSITNNYSINVIQTNNINPNQNISKDINNNSKRIINQNYKTNKNYIFEYTIYELNNLEYSEAVKKDKRNYFQYYLSLLKTKHLLFFSFCKIYDYNSRIIKIYLFFYSFVIYYLVNTLFFNDATMHKIYTDFGSYNIIYQLPQVLYSSLISSVLNLIIKTLSLTEKNIIDIKKYKKNVKNKKMN